MSPNSSKRYLKAKYIVVWHNGRHEVLEDGCLGIDGNVISGFGKTPPEASAKVEDLGDCVIIPGFINLHCHPAWSPILKSFIDDVGSKHFYHSVLFEYANSLRYSNEDCVDAARHNIAALLLSGCTTLVDPGSQISDKIVDLMGEIGVRGYVGYAYRTGIWRTEDGHSLIHPLEEEKGLEQLAQAIEFVERYDNAYDGRIRTIFGPTQTTTCTPRLLRETREAANKVGAGVTIHASEALLEFQDCLRRYGMTPFEMLDDAGLVGPDVLIGHGTFPSGHSQVNYPSKRDLQIVAESQTSVAHCPFVFAMRGYAMESYPRYLKMGINVGFGTDTYSADYLQEMRWGCGVGKLMERSVFEATAADAFNSATIRGAQALRRPDLGRLGAGTQADMVVVRLDNFEMNPVRDVIKNLVYCGDRHAVDQVYVGGKCLVKEGKVIGLDEGALFKRVQEVGDGAWSGTQNYDWAKRTADEMAPPSLPKCDVGDWS